MIAILSFLVLLMTLVAAQPNVSDLDPEDFKMGIDAGEYDVIIDVRTQEEWDAGHIEGATLALNLASYPDTGVETATPADFAGCESCTIVIYCRSGNRANTALGIMYDSGFNGTLYNGMGINQWTAAGYSLVTTGDSVVPPCTLNQVGQCTAIVPSVAPSAAPSARSGKVITLEPEAIKNGIDNGDFDAIIDVRTLEEWEEGHIEGSTFALNLAMFGDPTRVTASPADFMGCETCTLLVYCRTGGRAAAALDNLIAAGFNGTLYNGQGTSQWTDAGYPLVTTDSVTPPCTKSDIGTCVAVTVTTLQPEAIKNGIDNGDFSAIIDVRTQEEWDEGHIEGATFALNLAMFGDPTRVTASPADFMGCETCTLLVYCRSGGRAAAALDNLIAAGFTGTLYNGQGTSQWTDAGYPLVTTGSVTPPCTKSDIGTCVAAKVTTLQPEAIKNGIDNGDFDAIIDVRTQEEWDEGHIEGATFALNLAMFGDPTRATASPADFMGCETCTLLVYCRSGGRAAAALDNLIAAGFTGTLYNGQGTSQWTDAGYPLVTNDSVTPPCTKSDIGTCVAEAISTAPTVAPTTNATTGDTQAESAASIQFFISPMAMLVGILSALQLYV